MSDIRVKRLLDTRAHEAELASLRNDIYRECIRQRKLEKAAAIKRQKIEQANKLVEASSLELLDAVADIGRAHREAEIVQKQKKITEKNATMERRHRATRTHTRTMIAADKVRAAENARIATANEAERLRTIRLNETRSNREDAHKVAEANRQQQEVYNRTVVVERFIDPPPIRSSKIITLDHMRRTKGPLPDENLVKVIRHITPEEQMKSVACLSNSFKKLPKPNSKPSYTPMANTIVADRTVISDISQESMKGQRKLYAKVLWELKDKWVAKSRNKYANVTILEEKELKQFEISLRTLSNLDNSKARKRINNLDMVTYGTNNATIEEQFEALFVDQPKEKIGTETIPHAKKPAQDNVGQAGSELDVKLDMDESASDSNAVQRIIDMQRKQMERKKQHEQLKLLESKRKITSEPTETKPWRVYSKKHPAPVVQSTSAVSDIYINNMPGEYFEDLENQKFGHLSSASASSIVTSIGADADNSDSQSISTNNTSRSIIYNTSSDESENPMNATNRDIHVRIPDIDVRDPTPTERSNYHDNVEIVTNTTTHTTSVTTDTNSMNINDIIRPLIHVYETQNYSKLLEMDSQETDSEVMMTENGEASDDAENSIRKVSMSKSHANPPIDFNSTIRVERGANRGSKPWYEDEADVEAYELDRVNASGYEGGIDDWNMSDEQSSSSNNQSSAIDTSAKSSGNDNGNGTGNVQFNLDLTPLSLEVGDFGRFSDEEDLEDKKKSYGRKGTPHVKRSNIQYDSDISIDSSADTDMDVTINRMNQQSGADTYMEEYVIANSILGSSDYSNITDDDELVVDVHDFKELEPNEFESDFNSSLGLRPLEENNVSLRDVVQTDTSADANSGADVDTDTSADANSGADVDTNTSADANSGADVDTDTSADANSGADVDTSLDISVLPNFSLEEQMLINKILEDTRVKTEEYEDFKQVELDVGHQLGLDSNFETMENDGDDVHDSYSMSMGLETIPESGEELESADSVEVLRRELGKAKGGQQPSSAVKGLDVQREKEVKLETVVQPDQEVHVDPGREMGASSDADVPVERTDMKDKMYKSTQTSAGYSLSQALSTTAASNALQRGKLGQKNKSNKAKGVKKVVVGVDTLPPPPPPLPIPENTMKSQSPKKSVEPKKQVEVRSPSQSKPKLPVPPPVQTSQLPPISTMRSERITAVSAVSPAGAKPSATSGLIPDNIRDSVKYNRKVEDKKLVVHEVIVAADPISNSSHSEPDPEAVVEKPPDGISNSISSALNDTIYLSSDDDVSTISVGHSSSGSSMGASTLGIMPSNLSNNSSLFDELNKNVQGKSKNESIDSLNFVLNSNRKTSVKNMELPSVSADTSINASLELGALLSTPSISSSDTSNIIPHSNVTTSTSDSGSKSDFSGTSSKSSRSITSQMSLDEMFKYSEKSKDLQKKWEEQLNHTSALIHSNANSSSVYIDLLKELEDLEEEDGSESLLGLVPGKESQDDDDEDSLQFLGFDVGDSVDAVTNSIDSTASSSSIPLPKLTANVRSPLNYPLKTTNASRDHHLGKDEEGSASAIDIFSISDTTGSLEENKFFHDLVNNVDTEDAMPATKRSSNDISTAYSEVKNYDDSSKGLSAPSVTASASVSVSESNSTSLPSFLMYVNDGKSELESNSESNLQTGEPDKQSDV